MIALGGARGGDALERPRLSDTRERGGGPLTIQASPMVVRWLQVAHLFLYVANQKGILDQC